MATLILYRSAKYPKNGVKITHPNLPAKLYTDSKVALFADDISRLIK